MFEEIGPDPIIIKSNRGERMIKSDAARKRRTDTKLVKSVQDYKDEKESRERMKAKKRLERQKKRTRRKEMSLI